MKKQIHFKNKQYNAIRVKINYNGEENVKIELIKTESKILKEIEVPRGLNTCLYLPSD